MASIECLVPSVNDSTNLAIIFIHGLDGHPIDTWMHDKSDLSTIWPTWLSDDVDCSVWCIGYDASLSGWKGSAMPLPDQGDSVLDTLASEPGLRDQSLLLVGHSMGGLVIKTLIQNGRTKGVERFENVVESIRGVVFVATPHKGSQLATLAKHMSLVLRTNPQVDNMQNHDPYLRSLNQQFLAYYNNTNTDVYVRTFAETKGVLLGKRIFGFNFGKRQLVVDPDAAEPHIPNEIAIRLPQDHIGICKLRDKNEQLYKSLLSFIRDEMKFRSSKKVTNFMSSVENDVSLSKIRIKLYSAPSTSELEKIEYQLEEYLSLNPHSSEAKILLNKVTRAAFSDEVREPQSRYILNHFVKAGRPQLRIPRGAFATLLIIPFITIFAYKSMNSKDDAMLAIDYAIKSAAYDAARASSESDKLMASDGALRIASAGGDEKMIDGAKMTVDEEKDEEKDEADHIAIKDDVDATIKAL